MYRTCLLLLFKVDPSLTWNVINLTCCTELDFNLSRLLIQIASGIICHFSVPQGAENQNRLFNLIPPQAPWNVLFHEKTSRSQGLKYFYVIFRVSYKRNLRRIPCTNTCISCRLWYIFQQWLSFRCGAWNTITWMDGWKVTEIVFHTWKILSSNSIVPQFPQKNNK